MAYGVVYLIWNMLNGKKYVGQTTQPLKRRISGHKSDKKSFIGKAIRKYGAENFRLGVIKTCTSKAELDYWEKFFIAALKSKSPYGYNLTGGGVGLKSPSEETVAKMKMSSKKRWEKGGDTLETRAKKSIAHLGEKNHFYGKHHTEKARKKMGLSSRGNKNMLGKHHTAKTCSTISLNKRNNSPFKNLLREIDKQQLSYNSLAKILDLSQPNVSAKMHGKKNFTAKDIAKLVEFFGKPAEYLMARN